MSSVLFILSGVFAVIGEAQAACKADAFLLDDAANAVILGKFTMLEDGTPSVCGPFRVMRGETWSSQVFTRAEGRVSRTAMVAVGEDGKEYVITPEADYGPYDDVHILDAYKGHVAYVGIQGGKSRLHVGTMSGPAYDAIDAVGSDLTYYAIRDAMFYLVRWPDIEQADPYGTFEQQIHAAEVAMRK